jgi:hypothetical protein
MLRLNPALSARAATGRPCSRISTVTRLRRIEVRDRIFFLTFNIVRGAATMSETEKDLLLTTLQSLRGPDDFALMAMLSCPTTHTSFFTQEPFRCQKSCAT